ncbi:MAG: ABC transporter ATP-binding protein [Clostridia bacterium]|nr:ABC transporter ATP-binding protein [Clostridia bacterium]
MSAVTVCGLCKKYPSFTLDNVSFSLEKGRIAGFIGRNGAGKTTTIKSMLNLVHPDGGEVDYFGMPLNENESKIKQRIGYSTGTISYYPKKKIRDIAAVTKKFFSEWNEDAYKTYLNMFELDENKMTSELSEGMKVKFNLLLALSHNAEVLILDEPTSGLDPFSRDDLLNLFIQLRENGTAILFSTHITSDIEKCADDIIYIRKGRIEAAMPKENFRSEFRLDGETLEETFLRLERSGA